MIFGRKPLSARAFGGVVLFTLVETLILAAWLALANTHYAVQAVIVLVAGLGVEHYIATQVGRDQ